MTKFFKSFGGEMRILLIFCVLTICYSQDDFRTPINYTKVSKLGKNMLGKWDSKQGIVRIFVSKGMPGLVIGNKKYNIPFIFRSKFKNKVYHLILNDGNNYTRAKLSVPNKKGMEFSYNKNFSNKPVSAWNKLVTGEKWNLKKNNDTVLPSNPLLPADPNLPGSPAFPIGAITEKRLKTWVESDIPNHLLTGWSQNNKLRVNITANGVQFDDEQFNIIETYRHNDHFLIIVHSNGLFAGIFFQNYKDNYKAHIHKTAYLTRKEAVLIFPFQSLYYEEYYRKVEVPDGSLAVQMKELRWSDLDFPQDLNQKFYTISGQMLFEFKNSNSVDYDERFYSIVANLQRGTDMLFVGTNDNQFYGFLIKNRYGEALEIAKLGPTQTFAEVLKLDPNKFIFATQVKPAEEEKIPWQEVSFPFELYGGWYNKNRVWNYDIANSSSIRTDNKQYRIEKILSHNGIYKIITNDLGQYVAFHFSIESTRKIAVERSKKYKSFAEALRAKVGKLETHTK